MDSSYMYSAIFYFTTRTISMASAASLVAAATTAPTYKTDIFSLIMANATMLELDKNASNFCFLV